MEVCDETILKRRKNLVEEEAFLSGGRPETGWDFGLK